MTDDKGRPTMEDVAAEVKRLKAMKPKIRHYTVFEDDNRKAVQADIQVLETGMSENEIYDRWGDDNEYTLDSALGAREWLDGDESARPSDNWTPLVVD